MERSENHDEPDSSEVLVNPYTTQMAAALQLPSHAARPPIASRRQMVPRFVTDDIFQEQRQQKQRELAEAAEAKQKAKAAKKAVREEKQKALIMQREEKKRCKEEKKAQQEAAKAQKAQNRARRGQRQ